MNLNVPDTLPSTIVELLKEDERLSNLISEAYDCIIHNYTLKEDERNRIRVKVGLLRSERSMVLAKLCGHWRAVMTINAIEWEDAK
jgi:hypothetical protein